MVVHIALGWRAFWLTAISLMAVSCRFEDRVIFQPSVTIDQSPRDVGLDFEDLYFNARGSDRYFEQLRQFIEETAPRRWSP